MWVNHTDDGGRKEIKKRENGKGKGKRKKKRKIGGKKKHKRKWEGYYGHFTLLSTLVVLPNVFPKQIQLPHRIRSTSTVTA
jgi:hypothetical protein